MLSLSYAGKRAYSAAKLVEFYGMMPRELIGTMCWPTVPAPPLPLPSFGTMSQSFTSQQKMSLGEHLNSNFMKLWTLADFLMAVYKTGIWMPLNIYRKIRFLFNFNTRISLQKYGFENQTARPWKTLHITKKKKGLKIKMF